MVKINGEERNLAGKNLLEYLKESGFEPERVVVELKPGDHSTGETWKCNHSG